MVVEVREIDEQELFKISKLNLRGKSKELYKKLAISPIDWLALKVVMLLKYGTIDKEEVWAKLDQLKQEPK
jgi:hypothetical protein